jgi:putative membrane protein
MPTEIVLLLWAVGGALVAAVLSIVPALHVYNVAGFLLLATATYGELILPEALAFFFLGMVTGYAILNSIASIFLSVPDDSTIFIVLPGQKYLLQRRGYEAIVLSGLGGLGGILVLVLLTPFTSNVLPMVRAVLTPHMAWILWTIIAYMLISEWPKGSDRAPAGIRRWWEGWKSLTAGLITFFLSGLLGFVLMYRSPVPITVGYQSLLPAFIGLFAVPWVLQNIIARTEIPSQHFCCSVDANASVLLRGTLAGSLGGLFAAMFPLVTGGIGGFLAGHATAQRDERVFVISQGASKVVYYVGGFLFFFAPGLQRVKGGMAAMLSTIWGGTTPQFYLLAVGAIVLTGVLSFFLSLALTRLVVAVLARVDYRWISVATLAILLTIVIGMTGLGGLLVCAVATGIGLIPPLWGSRRMNCMGVLLLPIALSMTGVGDTVAGWLGLL